MSAVAGDRKVSGKNTPNYLVTGGAGFIGSHLVDSLIARGASVTVFDDLSSGSPANLNPVAKFIKATVVDEAAVRNAVEASDGVFHLAARVSVQDCIDNWLPGHFDNVVGSIHVMAAAADVGCPVVYASSAAVYGDRSGEACREDLQEKPISPYGADKLACEHQARAFKNTKGLSSIGLRFFNVYGPRQDPSSPYAGVISRFISNLVHGVDHTIYGDGQQTRDFIEVSDVVRGMIAAMQHCRLNPTSGEVINLCTGKGTNLLDLCGIMGSLQGKSDHRIVHHPARSGDIRGSLGCPKHAEEALDFIAMVKLNQGLRRLMGLDSSIQ